MYERNLLDQSGFFAFTPDSSGEVRFLLVAPTLRFNGALTKELPGKLAMFWSPAAKEAT